MTVLNRVSQFGAAPEEDRRTLQQPTERMIGRVISCDGSTAIISTVAEALTSASTDFWAIGKLISISLETSRIVGLVYKINAASALWQEDKPNSMHVKVELVGQVRDAPDGKPVFSRGIATYPPLGAVAHRIRAADLAAVHNPVGRRTAAIGTLSQDESIPAVVCVDDMLKRHFAVVGTTGAGKSTAVSLLLHNVTRTRPDLRVLILDPHNEFSRAFPNNSVAISPDTLELPFWLFQLEEFAEVIFRGRDADQEQIDALRDLIPVAKARFNQKSLQSGSSIKKPIEASTITADTPIPYRMTELFALVEESIGQLEGRHDRSVLRLLKNRLEALVNDPRYRFMFTSRTVEDNISQVIGNIFRIPNNNKPITVFQLAGMPSEVVNSVVSVLCRMAFDVAMWSGGGFEICVVCEEAHRYVPQDHRLGFAPTRQSIARIAKEGRKYGAYLGIVTQRPGELDPTILSQCSTVFAMRLANDRDQDIIRSAIADSSASTTSFLSSIGNREAIAFGEGTATPMRMRFADLPEQFIPGSSHQPAATAGANGQSDVNIDRVVMRMRAMNRAAL